MSVIATAGIARVGDALPDATFEAIAVPDARRLYSSIELTAVSR
jgi:hypothetical protein